MANWNNERNNPAIYQSLANTVKEPCLAEIYACLVLAELKHAEKWEKYLAEGGESLPSFRPGWRTRTLIWSSKHLGPEVVLPSIQGIGQN